MLRESTLDDFIAHLQETYTRVSPEAWQDFKAQVIAIGNQYGGNVPCQFTYDPGNNTIKASIARRNVRGATLN